MSHAQDKLAVAGRTILVTGASSGIGRHFAHMLATEGAYVAAAARRVEALDKLKAEIEHAGGRCRVVPMDVTDAAGVRDAVAALAKDGPIHGLVNCSGISDTVRLLEQSEESWAKLIDTNLTGAWRVLQATAAEMAKTGGGSIVNIASILGLRQSGQLAAYAASKAALVQLTKQAALELARHDIRVNALAPGYFQTEINRGFFATDAGKAIISRIPQRRLGDLTDLDAPLLLLLGDGSRYMTGAVIPVDGGHLVSSL
jgi:NAD(P)-dependent dehydrogenase (short-subunit alcohol dehydrogenase family)